VLDDLTRYGDTHTVVTTSRGTISGVEAFPVVGTQRWRMMFDLSDLAGEPADLRAFLQKDNVRLSETWIYEAFP
jgi:glucans biosynthesis protein